MRFKSTKTGLKKVDFFGLTVAELEIKPFDFNGTKYNARITHFDKNQTYYTDARLAVVNFTNTAKLIYTFNPNS